MFRFERDDLSNKELVAVLSYISIVLTQEAQQSLSEIWLSIIKDRVDKEVLETVVTSQSTTTEQKAAAFKRKYSAFQANCTPAELQPAHVKKIPKAPRAAKNRRIEPKASIGRTRSNVQLSNQFNEAESLSATYNIEAFENVYGNLPTDLNHEIHDSRQFWPDNTFADGEIYDSRQFWPDHSLAEGEIYDSRQFWPDHSFAEGEIYDSRQFWPV